MRPGASPFRVVNAGPRRRADIGIPGIADPRYPALSGCGTRFALGARMKKPLRTRIRTWVGTFVLFGGLAAAGVALASWKASEMQAAEAAAASQPEPQAAITAAIAEQREYRRTTTAIGTVIALQSITLHNELPGTVALTRLEPGRLVEPGEVLVALDVAVEEAELQAQRAEVALAETMLARMQRANGQGAAAAADVDRARAERDIAKARVTRTEAIIARKTIKAPFRARIGMADLHVGQYLDGGAFLTTLQGVGEAVHVDFMVTQATAAGLTPGDIVRVFASGEGSARDARIVAIDARVDAATRNATVRARLEGAGPRPGASVRVVVPNGPAEHVVVVPVSALRRGPEGDHVYVLSEDEGGVLRAHFRPVEGGPMLGDEVVLRGGLEAGVRVAASGSFKLHEAMRVVLMEPTTAR